MSGSGYTVNIYNIYRNEPIRSAWFVDWIAAINDAIFEKSKIEPNSYIEVKQLSTKKIVKYE